MKLITNIQPPFLPDILFKQSKSLKEIRAAVAYCKDYRLFEYCKKHKIKLDYYGRLDFSINLNLKDLKNFLTDDISIHIIGGDKFHPKVIQCYGYGAYIGSANLTKSAWEDNIECGLWLTQEELEDNGLIDPLDEFFTFIQQKSKPLSGISDRDISELNEYKSNKFENQKNSAMITIKKTVGVFEGCSKKEHSDIEPQFKKGLQSDHKTKNQGDTMLKSINNEKELFKNKILEFLKENNGFFGAPKISKALKIPEKIRRHNSWGTHDLLWELLKEGKITQKKGRGFKYLNKESAHITRPQPRKHLQSDQQISSNRTYRKGSDWNDMTEMMCLLISKILKTEKFPRGMKSKLCEEMSFRKDVNLTSGTIQMKIGNYEYIDTGGKAGLEGYSSNAKLIYELCHKLSIKELTEKIQSLTEYEFNGFSDKN